MNNSSNVVIVGKITKPLEVKEVSTANGNKKVGNMTVSAVKQVKQPDGGVSHGADVLRSQYVECSATRKFV